MNETKELDSTTGGAETARRFRALHVKGDPLVLYNIWDAGSAKTVADSGAPAIATGSWAVAVANGQNDGEQLAPEIVFHNLRLIVAAVDLPVTVDLESGYGPEPQQVAATVTSAIEAGAVGLNLEDQIIGADALFSVADQSRRIAACRRAADATGVQAFINARTDVFMQAGPDAEADLLLKEVIERAAAYGDAGADGLFVPGLIDEAAIEALCSAIKLPVNIMMLPNCPDRATLSQLGVARISYGPGPYRSAMKLLADEATDIYS